MQWKYRSRGFIASNGGKSARFDVFTLALLLFIRSMNDRNIGFVATRTLGPRTTDAIVRRVLRHAAAFDLAGLGADENASLDDLAEGVLAAHSSLGAENAGIDAGRFVVAWVNGEMSFSDDTGPAFFEAAAAQDPQRVCGPVTIFDTQAAADELLKRAGRPLVHMGARAVPFEAFSGAGAGAGGGGVTVTPESLLTYTDLQSAQASANVV